MDSPVLENSKTYQEIKKRICKLLINDWRPNDRLPPIKKLARDMGVGQSSTHHAIRELVREGILVSKPRMGTFVNNNLEKMKSQLELIMDNKTPQMKSPLADKKVQVITYRAILEHQTFFIHAFKAFMDLMSTCGCKIVTSLIDPTITTTPLDKTADGVVVINPSNFFDIQCLPSQVLTVIRASSESMAHIGERYDLIASDDIQGSLLAGKYLKNHGYNEVAYLGVKNILNPVAFDKISIARLEGLSMGLGHPVLPEWHLWSEDYGNIGYGNFGSAQMVKKWLQLSPRPSAIYAATDDLAYGFIIGAMAHGLFPGKDYQILGFDAQRHAAFYNNLVLTSISIPIDEMGTLAATMLMKRLENPNLPPQRIYLGCKLYEGNTVK